VLVVVVDETLKEEDWNRSGEVAAVIDFEFQLLLWLIRPPEH